MTGESAQMYFEQLQERLLVRLKSRIQNGELTERGLAKLTGISQPHIHNVLKGVRKFSPEVADFILRRMNLEILDLFERKEITDYLSKGVPAELRYCRVPLLNGLIGPGLPTPKPAASPTDCYSIPFSQMKAITDPVAARLSFDPEMRSIFSGNEVVLLDQSEMCRAFIEPQSYYVVLTPRGTLIRKARRADGDKLLLSIENAVTVTEPLMLNGRDILEVVLARVVWLTRQRRWEDIDHLRSDAASS